MLREISAHGFAAPTSPLNEGPAPQLQWLEIKLLKVDTTYQREIGRRGTINIRHIAENFDWSKFAPVIVAPLEGGEYAVVDGQHRTTAAILRGFEKVPCQIVQADRAKQAAAYTAVNGHVTKTTPQQLFHARLAAGEKSAIELAEACAEADVKIVHRNLSPATTKVGETRAVNCLIRCLEVHGRETLITALKCITKTGDGNPAMVRSTIIQCLCEILDDCPEWRDADEKLLRALDDFEFADVWEKAITEHNYVLSPSVKTSVSEAIRVHLHRRLNKAKQKKSSSPANAERGAHAALA